MAKPFNPSEFARVTTAVTAAYHIGYCDWPLEDVYAWRLKGLTDDTLASDLAIADYDTVWGLFEEYHNGLRTIWRRRRHRWLEPLRDTLETEDILESRKIILPR